MSLSVRRSLFFILSQSTEEQDIVRFNIGVCRIPLTAPTGDVHPEFYRNGFPFLLWLSPNGHLSFFVPYPKPYLS